MWSSVWKSAQLRKPLTVTVITLATMAFTSTSAHAGAIPVAYAGASAQVYPTRIASICDTQTDGNGVFVVVYPGYGGGLGPEHAGKKYWDGSGHDSDCGGPYYPDNGILAFKVCEDHTGCSDLKQATSGWQ